MQLLALFDFCNVGGQLLVAASVASVTALGALALWKQCAAEKVWGLVLANEPNLWMRMMFQALKIPQEDGSQASAGPWSGPPAYLI